MEKKFYTLTNSTDYVEVGDWMQIEEVYKYKDENYGDYQSFRHDSDLEKLPNKLQFEFQESANITDFVSNSLLQGGPNMNQNAKGLFSNFKIGGEYKYINIQCYQKRRKHDYFFFLLRELKDLISYPKSIFDINVILAQELGELVSFQNYKEYKMKFDEVTLGKGIKTIYARKLIVTENVDILRPPGTNEIIVSEDVKNEYEKLKLNGIEFEPATCRIVVDN